MKEYQKIESLYKFDSSIKKFRREFYNPIVEYLANCEWYATEKIDGTNVRILWNGHHFEFGARTDDGDLPKALRELLEKTFNYEMEILFEQKFGEKEVMLFMEGYAGKIQNGTYSGPESLIGFDVMIGDIYLDKAVSLQIFRELGLKPVPLMSFPNIYECIDYVYHNTQSIIQPESKIEGLVCCPVKRIYDHMGNRIIVKIKNKDLAKLVD